MLPGLFCLIIIVYGVHSEKLLRNPLSRPAPGGRDRPAAHGTRRRSSVVTPGGTTLSKLAPDGLSVQQHDSHSLRVLHGYMHCIGHA